MAIDEKSREFEHKGKTYRVVDANCPPREGFQLFAVIEADADLSQRHWRSAFGLESRLDKLGLMQQELDAQKIFHAEGIREARLEEEGVLT